MNPYSNDAANLGELLTLCGYDLKQLSLFVHQGRKSHELLHHDDIGWYLVKYEVHCTLTSSAFTLEDVLKPLPTNHGFEGWCADHGIDLVPHAPSSSIYWAKPADAVAEMALKMRWG